MFTSYMSHNIKNTPNITYDAKGERVYKLTSDKGGMEFDGDKVHAYFIWSDATLYPNPYLTITPTGYTKHYYANSERLSTVLGEGGWFLMSRDAISDLTQDEEHDIGHAFERYSELFPLGLPSAVLTKNKDIDEQVVQDLQYDCPQETLVSIDLDCTMNPNALYSRMYRNLAVNGTETNVYYTHNDHLGSASWITDRYAHPTQYLHYLPYGQLLANQSPSGYDERFKFIGKERDWESGYDYFGARYYISPFLHWMSVDPLSDEDPGISPYAYCRWNPVRLVDRNGKEWLTDDDAKQASEYIEKMRGQMTMYMQILMEYGNEEQNNDIKDYIYDLRQRIRCLRGGISELQQMGETKEQSFTYKSSDDSSAGYTEIDPTTGTINMAVPKGNDALGVHESSHGYDFWKNRVTAMESELKAYQRQYSFDQTSMPKSVNLSGNVTRFDMITPSYIIGIYDNNHQFPYLYLK